ncbi:MAG: hypothetical protein AAF423_07155 [Pseudomonadota bacterium]
MLRSLKSFLTDSSANIALTGGLMMIPLMGSVGAAVDYTNFINLRNDIQISLDSAGLASGREVANGEDDEAALETYSENFFRTNLSDKVKPESYEFSFTLVRGNANVVPPTPDRVNICADIDYQTLFGAFIGVDKLEERICSQISLGNRTVEVALVLDNSGSMGGSRIDTLITEANALVDTIFNSAQLTTLPTPVQFSLVPFAGTVNIGTNNQNESWMDRKGWSPVHHENFDWVNTYRTNNQTRTRTTDGLIRSFQERVNGSWQWRTRHDVFEMVGEQWGGCVEMRPWPHNIMDTVANTNQFYRAVRDSVDADGDGQGDGTSALFVPYFAPDEPDHRYPEQLANFDQLFPVSPNSDHDGDDDVYRNNYLYDFQDYDQNDPVPYPNDRDQLHTHQTQPGLPHGNPARNVFGSTRQIERTDWVFKYQRNAQYRGSLNQYHGPNDGCTTQAITELTDDRAVVQANINQMTADGTTNIQQGLTWGWRTLSPGEPFVGGREYDDRHNLKFIILLTDGNNFYSSDGDSTPNNTAYGAWGYARPANTSIFSGEPTHNRWIEGLDELDGTIYESTLFDLTPESSGDFEAIMNAHTLQACNNVKNSGVSIYTIAFSVPSSGGVRQLLEACAGSGIRENREIIPNTTFYHDVGGDELRSALGDIAKQISNLRVSG